MSALQWLHIPSWQAHTQCWYPTLRKHVSAVRLRVDIADLALERVEGVQLTGRVFAGGKHLCGAATG